MQVIIIKQDKHTISLKLIMYILCAYCVCVCVCLSLSAHMHSKSPCVCVCVCLLLHYQLKRCILTFIFFSDFDFDSWICKIKLSFQVTAIFF